MHGSLGHFKATLQRNKARKAKAEGKFDKKKLKYNSQEKKVEFDFPELSKAEMENLKQKIRSDIRKSRHKNYILYCFVVIAIFVLIYYFVS